MINEERLIVSFIKMVEISSVSGREGQMRDLLISEFSARGLAVLEDDAAEQLHGNSGNILVRIPGNADGKVLLFAAHLDTVQPGEGVKALVTRERSIKSQGHTILGSDDKAAIAALLEAYDVICEQKISHPPLELLFTVGEEQGLLGAKAFDCSQLQAEMGFVLDAGGDPGDIVIQSPCQNEIEYCVYGQAAHAGINPEDGINAIKIAALALAHMPCGRIDSETTCNFGIIEGGTARNIVADSCRIQGEARSLDRTGLEKITNRLTAIFKHEVEKQGARAEVNIKFLYPEIKLDSDQEVVKLAARAAESIGLSPHFLSTGGGSDASIINGKGIACVNLGVGMRAVHTVDEYITVDDLVNDARLVIAIIAAAVGQ